MQEDNFNMIYKATNTKMKGVKRHGDKPLNFFTFFKSTINGLDEDGNPTNQSTVEFRFHSSKAFCNKTHNEHIKLHGGIHVRVFTYEGIDKTEQELIDWALTTDQVANDSVTTIYQAKEV